MLQKAVDITAWPWIRGEEGGNRGAVAKSGRQVYWMMALAGGPRSPRCWREDTVVCRKGTHGGSSSRTFVLWEAR